MGIGLPLWCFKKLDFTSLEACDLCCRDGDWPHGVCWSLLCEELEVVDVPGDHFSLLRQVIIMQPDGYNIDYVDS